MNHLKYQQDLLSAWSKGAPIYYQEDMDNVWLCFDGYIVMRMPIARCAVDFRRIGIEKENVFSSLYHRCMADINRYAAAGKIDFSGYIFLENTNVRVFQKGCYSKYFGIKDSCLIAGQRDPIIYTERGTGCCAIVMPVNPATVPKEYGGELK